MKRTEEKKENKVRGIKKNHKCNNKERIYNNDNDGHGSEKKEHEEKELE